MIERTVYDAFDGMTFETKEECVAHEEGANSVIKAMEVIKEFCKSMEGKDCKYCQYYKYCDADNTIPRYWFDELDEFE